MITLPPSGRPVWVTDLIDYEVVRRSDLPSCVDMPPRGLDSSVGPGQMPALFPYLYATN